MTKKANRPAVGLPPLAIGRHGAHLPEVVRKRVEEDLKRLEWEASGLPPEAIALLGVILQSVDLPKRACEKAEEDFKRMERLADSLEIPDSSSRWYFVALHLAKQHAPELKKVRRVGAPKKWGITELGVLAVEIERITATGKTIEQAAKALAVVAPWKGFVGTKTRGAHVGPDPAAALLRAYADAKKSPLTSMMRWGFERHKLEGTEHEWEREHVQTVGNRRK